MMFGVNVCFISCYCCYWTTGKSTWTSLNRAEKKQEKKNRLDSQTYKTAERGKQVFDFDETRMEVEAGRGGKKGGEGERDRDSRQSLNTCVRNSLKTKEDKKKC